MTDIPLIKPGDSSDAAAVLTRKSSAPEAALRALTQDRRSNATQRAYAADLRDFFRWRGQAVTPEAVADLCRLSAGELTAVLSAYQADMVARKLAESTGNRRLSAVRSLLRLARRMGAGNPDPAGLVLSERVHAYRDTRGVTPGDVHRLLEAPDRKTLTGKRDYALLLLLWVNALRRGEVCACDVGDFEAAGRRLLIRGKGKGTQKEPVTLTERTAAAIGDYLGARGSRPPGAPLFVNAAHFAKSAAYGGREGEMRLAPNGLYLIVQGYGRAVLGKALRPHQIRHTAITAVLDATNGDVRTAQRLSRHADIRTLQRYDDNREDLQGKASALLDALA